MKGHMPKRGKMHTNSHAPGRRARRAGSGVDVTLARHGGLSYIEIPAIDAAHSARFYQNVAGWFPRDVESGEAKFSDPAGNLIGRWITGRRAARGGGILPFVYVEDLQAAVAQVAPHGGETVKPPYREGTLLVAIVRDPAGNVLGLWQDAGIGS